MREGDLAAVMASVVGLVLAVGGATFEFGQLRQEVLHERELRHKDMEAAKLSAQKYVEAAKLAAQKDVMGVRLDMERRIADFMTKGDYKGVLEAIDAAKLQREAVKNKVWSKGGWGQRGYSRLQGNEGQEVDGGNVSAF